MLLVFHWCLALLRAISFRLASVSSALASGIHITMAEFGASVSELLAHWMACHGKSVCGKALTTLQGLVVNL